MPTTDTAWATLIDEAEEALRIARRLASERPAGSPDQAAAASMATRLPEFIRDVRLAVRRGRTDQPAYRSVFEQLVTTLRAVA